MWQARINGGWRFYFQIEENTCYLLDIIRHPKQGVMQRVPGSRDSEHRPVSRLRVLSINSDPSSLAQRV